MKAWQLIKRIALWASLACGAWIVGPVQAHETAADYPAWIFACSPEEPVRAILRLLGTPASLRSHTAEEEEEAWSFNGSHSTLIQPPPLNADKEARAHLPPEAESWEYVGTFALSDQGKDRLIVVYYRESGRFCYPNGFAVYVAYQDEGGVWTHKQVYARARVGFVKVRSSSPEGLILDLVPRFMIELPPENGVEELLRQVGILKVPAPTPAEVLLKLAPTFLIHFNGTSLYAERLSRSAQLNRPFTARLAFENGAPVMK
jgi:hypothetical protein